MACPKLQGCHLSALFLYVMCVCGAQAEHWVEGIIHMVNLARNQGSKDGFLLSRLPGRDQWEHRW